MKIRNIILSFMFLLSASSMISAQVNVSPTRYDYSQVSRQITNGCSTKMEQAKAIYRWLCDNISYDTSYSIYDADNCIDQRRGVCQAYCELFYRIAEPIGLETIIVSGKTKEEDGSLASSGHAWLIVRTDQYHIFIDPTWGAGSVNNGVFTRNHRDDYSWFNVSPSWMIFNHFPDDSSMQMLDTPIDMATFMKLPQNIQPYYGNYGLHAPSVLRQAIEGKLDIPELYNNAGRNFECLKIPLQKTLRIGEFYDFIVNKTGNCELAIFNENSTKEEKWHSDGSRRGIRFMPTKQNTVSLCVKDGDKYATMVEYQLAKPVQSDWDKVAEYFPFSLPQFKKIKGYSEELMEHFHIDGHRFYKLYKEGKVGNALPVLYEELVNIELIDAPLTDVLKIGNSYNFVFKAAAGVKLFIKNGAEHTPMDLYTDGTLRLSFVPKSNEDVVVLIDNGSSFGYVIAYKTE